MEQSTTQSNEMKSKVMKGKVVSDKNDNTLVVEVVIYKEHGKYRKKYESTKRYKVHDESGKYVEGGEVEFVACRPMSKDKRFKVL